MLITILPFFLAAYVSVPDNTDWQRYGPECTYNVLVNMSLANIVDERDNFCSMIRSELKCRPRHSDTLSCYFANGRIVRPSASDTRCTNRRDFVPISDRFVGDDPFEIRFNPRGIENLVVSRDIRRRELDMIRVIVGQLNVGFRMEEDGRDRFVTMENSSMGHCEVELKVSRARYEGDVGQREFEIIFEPEPPDTIPLNAASLTIDKVRQPTQCHNRRIYFFGNSEDFSLGNSGVFMNMTTSTSQMYISNREMYSFTETTGELTSSKLMPMYQKISLSLQSIAAARGPLPEIRRPASTSLYSYADV
ncbi:hypothetical protein K0M31_017792 [Melipona bicolor]|uniref:Vitellogenin domain-containing protein n=1 Tax=Melipona bicolor TaxID=60889 RepID=A0AA40G5M4_9HYME|nr:hypothetical protein K0M31_017792 [Melipona bicolor]